MRRARVTLLVLLGGCGEKYLDLPAPRLSSIQARVFSPSCTFSACHGGGNPRAGLSLVAGRSHSELVGVPAVTASSAPPRVTPGDADSSYLVRKLEGRDLEQNPPRYDETEAMPPDDRLEPEVIEVIREWIDRGAADD